MPGDAVVFTSNVTNIGTTLDVAGEIDVTNKGSSTFTVAGYQQTVEYLSVDTHGWVPVAKIAVDATGAVVPDPSMFAFSWAFASPISEPGVTYSANPIVGTTISAGAMAAWGFRFFPVLPGDVVSTIFDPSKASAVRVAIRFDTTSGPVPAPGAADMASFVAGVTGRIENPAYSRWAAPTISGWVTTSSSRQALCGTPRLNSSVPSPPSTSSGRAARRLRKRWRGEPTGVGWVIGPLSNGQSGGRTGYDKTLPARKGLEGSSLIVQEDLPGLGTLPARCR